MVIKRDEFIKILNDSNLDYEKFCFIRDNLALYNRFEYINENCYSCKSFGHSVENCPYLHMNEKKEGIIKRYCIGYK